MIIPIKCFTCGKVLADKYLYYISNVKKEKVRLNIKKDYVMYLSETTTKKTPEGEILDKLQLNKICCRRHMLTHVDII
uniref:DNA-directed RNA polymerase subunit N n=1 Tax=viral metagenome TaxID=1070528 RepID=A0A6C0F8P5_9ZZZZ|tara:strand:+ start:9049 stop:9282 length:234 start_codon:yes stop_codon:yes gene_type:complete